MTRQVILTSALVIVLCLTACGGGLPKSTSQGETHCPHQQSHPHHDFLIEEADASSIALARERASAELTRRMSAELRSEVKVQTIGTGRHQQDSVQERVSISSNFQHAELIRPIKQCERCSTGSCISVVAINRDELARRLLQTITPDLKRLLAAVQDLKAESPLLRFTQSWYIAQAAMKRMDPILNQLKLIERITKELQSAERLMKSATTERANREERLWIGINRPQFKGEEAPIQSLSEGVEGRLVKAIETLGQKRWTSDTCPDPLRESAEVIMLSPRGALSCSLGLIGPQCQLKLSVEMNLCHHGKLAEENWTEIKIIGVHTRETGAAINKLLKTLGRADLSGVLSKSLSPFIIL